MGARAIIISKPAHNSHQKFCAQAQGRVAQQLQIIWQAQRRPQRSLLKKKKGRFFNRPFGIFTFEYLSELFSGLRHRKDRNKRTVFEALAERYRAFNNCKDCVVFTLTNTITWPPLVTALTRNDVTGDDSFAAVFFDAETTSSGVTTVTG
jgi:hypothetical protein